MSGNIRLSSFCAFPPAQPAQAPGKLTVRIFHRVLLHRCRATACAAALGSRPSSAYPPRPASPPFARPYHISPALPYRFTYALPDARRAAQIEALPGRGKSNATCRRELQSPATSTQYSSTGFLHIHQPTGNGRFSHREPWLYCRHGHHHPLATEICRSSACQAK